MTPTKAKCPWCDKDRDLTSDGYFISHRTGRKGSHCRGSGKHRHQKPRTKKEGSPNE